MRTNALDLLVFKSSRYVDWKMTENKVVQALKEEYPDRRPSEQVMAYEKVMDTLRKLVKKAGVSFLYYKSLQPKDDVSVNVP